MNRFLISGAVATAETLLIYAMTHGGVQDHAHFNSGLLALWALFFAGNLVTASLLKNTA